VVVEAFFDYIKKSRMIMIDPARVAAKRKRMIGMVIDPSCI
jgi:hypothetical protein